MEVLRPKELDTHPGDEIVAWARDQLGIASSILDNPGGGLLFATQTIGQVRAGLHERDAERWATVVGLLDRAEDAAVRREFVTARQLVDEAARKLVQPEAAAFSVASKPAAPAWPLKGPTPGRVTPTSR